MAAARQETDYDFIHKISKTLLPLILSSCCWMHIQSIQYNMVEFLPYIFQCLYTLATFDVGWAAAVAKPKPHPPSITLLCPYVTMYGRLYQQLNSTEKREVVPSKREATGLCHKSHTHASSVNKQNDMCKLTTPSSIVYFLYSHTII